MQVNSAPSNTFPSKLPVYVCPGFHDAALTDQWVRSLPPFTQPHIFSAFCADPLAVHRWLSQQANATDPIVAVGFSAGVVGMAGALALWQQQGKQVARFFAVDGWGVPLVGLPVCRLSHDKFTHWSSLPLGAGKVNFYADPPVSHLAMWSSAQRVEGWQVDDWENGKSRGIAVTSGEFLAHQLRLEWAKVRI